MAPPPQAEVPGGIPIQRLQLVDRLLGPLVLLVLQPWRLLRRLSRRERDAAPERVLLIKFWGIGSLQLLTPAVAALRATHPGARLELLTLAENGDFAVGLGVFDEVLRLDVRCSSWTQIAHRILRLIFELRDRSYCRIVDFEFFTRFSVAVAFLASAQHSTGFRTASVWRGKLHTTGVTFNRYWHVARNFRALAGGEDGHEVNATEVQAFEPTSEDRAKLASKLTTVDDYVVFNVNAGRLSLERRWPREDYIALARRLFAETELNLVLVGATSERGYVAEITTALASHTRRVNDLAGALSLGELAALLEGAALLVSNDSGPMHIAAALGTPTLGLFGPETPQMYAPLGLRARALYRPTVCSPCINVHQNKVSTCVRGRPECLTNLQVDYVWECALAELSERSSLYPLRATRGLRRDA